MIPAFYRCTQFMLYCIFKIWNRFEVHGSPNLRPEGGFILAANHSSYLDPPVLGAGIRRPVTFLAKEELFKVPFLGPVIRGLGATPISGESDFRSLRTVIRLLRKGALVCIFPEGTRSHTGSISDETKSGVAFLAHIAGVPVVPCFIDGTDRALGRGSRFLRPAPIRVYLGDPVTVSDGTPEEKNTHYERATALVMGRIKELKETAERRKEE